MRKYNSVQKVLSSTLAISPLLSSARLFYSPFLFCSLPSSVLLILGVAESFTDSALAGSQTEDYCEPASPLFSPFFSPLLCSAPLCHPLPCRFPFLSCPTSLLFNSTLLLSSLSYFIVPCFFPLPSAPFPVLSSLPFSFLFFPFPVFSSCGLRFPFQLCLSSSLVFYAFPIPCFHSYLLPGLLYLSIARYMDFSVATARFFQPWFLITYETRRRKT